jgi:hypothetical protein
MKAQNFSLVYKVKDLQYIRICDYPKIKMDKTIIMQRNWPISGRDKIKIIFDYPLSIPVTKTFRSRAYHGFNEIDFLRCVYNGYVEIYDNPNKYGIWGHDFSDLVLEGYKELNDYGLFVTDLEVFELMVGS